MSLPWIFILTIVTLMFSQVANTNMFSRCRSESININGLNMPIDSLLCGNRQCPISTACLNPLSYNFIGD